MQQYTSYFSLSGFSGILLGIYGLLMVYVLHILTSTYGDGFDGSSQLPIALLEIVITIFGIVMILISLFTLWIRARRENKKQNSKLWNPFSKKTRLQTLVPLIFFIAVLIIVANKGYYSLITPLLLFLYGILLLNVSRVSLKRLRLLAIAEMILGIIAYFIYDNELLFLAIGLGAFHLLYGVFTLNQNKKAAIN